MASFYQPQTSSGNSFIGITAIAGVTIPIYSNTSQTFGIWNPAGNGKDAYLIGLDIGFVSGAATAAGSFGLTYAPNVGAAIAASNPITAATVAAPLNARLGAAIVQNTVRFIPATLTLATAPTVFITLGASSVTTTVANGFQTIHYDFYDAISVAPNTAAFVASNVATGLVADITLRWYEQ